MITITKNPITLLNIIGKDTMKQPKPVKTFIIRNKVTLEWLNKPFSSL